MLHEQLSREHLWAMSGITSEGKLLMMEQEGAFKGTDAVRFLKHALRQIPGKLLVIWDGARPSPSQHKVLEEFLKSGAASRLELERLPPATPRS